jgi:Tfp pilus assembly PilM family ATPase
MARTITGIDAGLRTVVLLKGQYKGNTFHAADFAVHANESGTLGGGWSEVEGGFKLGPSRVGLTGRDVNLRYTRVPRVPDWQLRKLMRFEVEGVGDQSGTGLASDFNLLPELPEIEGEDVVLLAMARDGLLEEHREGLNSIGGKLDGFSPNALALYNAWMRYGVVQDDTVLLANIGHDNMDVVICRGPDLVFARNLTGGSGLFDKAIAERFGVSLGKAEEIKIEQASLDPRASHADPNAEKASRAILGAAGQLQSLLQSTLLFSKSQLKITSLKIDRVMICGGGAALDGLPGWLSSAMHVPVELFDPFRVVKTEGLSPEAQQELEEYKLEAVVALGLATMGSDPDAYSVEILPERERKRREFWGGTAWLAAAGVLALGGLVNSYVSKSAELSELETELAQKETRVRRADRVDKSTRALLQENEALAEAAFELQGLAGAGEQIARSFDVLGRRMPDQFWLNRFASSWSFDPELGVERGFERPVLHFEGNAREGTAAMSTLYESLLSALTTELPSARLKAAPSPRGTRFEIDVTTLAPPASQESDDEEMEE